MNRDPPTFAHGTHDHARNFAHGPIGVAINKYRVPDSEVPFNLPILRLSSPTKSLPWTLLLKLLLQKQATWKIRLTVVAEEDDEAATVANATIANAATNATVASVATTVRARRTSATAVNVGTTADAGTTVTAASVAEDAVERNPEVSAEALKGAIAANAAEDATAVVRIATVASAAVGVARGAVVIRRAAATKDDAMTLEAAR